MGDYRVDDPELEESTNRWMAWGAVLLVLFVLAFPVYRIIQPSRLAAAQAALDQNLAAQGEEIFANNCAQCHGAEGAGAIGPALKSKQFLQSVTDQQMEQLISTGVPGTLMVAYGSDFGGPLTQEQIRAVVKYLRSFEEAAPDFPEWRTPLARSSLTGKDLYNLACAYCHGVNLEGNIGPDLGKGSDITEEPDEFIEKRIRRGKDEMPAFGNSLTDEQIQDIIDYLREVQQDP